VEGRHDVEFLRRISAILHAAHKDLPDLVERERHGDVLFIPAGGGDFRPWLRCLASLAGARFFLCDREIPPVSTQREQWAASVNSLPGCCAVVTGRRSLENYLHPDAIFEARGLRLDYSPSDDVPEVAARATFRHTPDRAAWDQLSRRARRRQRDRMKTWLNTSAVDHMTIERLAEADPAGEVRQWLTVMATLIG